MQLQRFGNISASFLRTNSFLSCFDAVSCDRTFSLGLNEKHRGWWLKHWNLGLIPAVIHTCH